jgi:hypothetical protein
MTVCVVGCQYIPSIEFFAHWLYHSEIIIEAHEHYQKKSWRNRTAILSPADPVYLSIPLKKGKHQKIPIKDVEISYDEDWPRIHFNAIQTAYGKTAFFHEIESDLKSILYARNEKLWDINLQLIQLMTQLIPGQWKYKFTEEYERIVKDSWVDFRLGIPAGVTTTKYQSFPTYQQVNRLERSHLLNLSILDALCHLGPELRNYLGRYAQILYSE